MKSMLVLICLLVAFPSVAQVYDEPNTGAAIEETMPIEEIPADYTADMEQQEEDVLHPVGEVNDWSLGGEDLPAEEYE
jgi:hypothetical protein